MTAVFRSTAEAQMAVLRGVASALQEIATDPDLPSELKPGVQFSLRVVKGTTARISELEDESA